MRTRTGALTAAIAAVAVAGCGGSSDKGPTKAEYIKRADAICKAAEIKLNTEAQKVLGSGATPTPAQISAFAAKTAVPNLEQQVKDLRALDQPSADKDELGSIYDALESGIAKLKANPLSGAALNDASAKAKAYGMKVCGAT